MNGKMNEVQSPNNRLWHCDVCEKKMIFSKRLRQIISNTHIHKEKFGIVIRDYEII